MKDETKETLKNAFDAVTVTVFLTCSVLLSSALCVAVYRTLTTAN